MVDRIIYVWAERTFLKGEPDKWTGYAMASDGTRVTQLTNASLPWIKSALGVTDVSVRKRLYDALYSGPYTVLWLDDPTSVVGWWNANFFDARVSVSHQTATSATLQVYTMRYKGETLGHVAYHPGMTAWYLVPRKDLPKTTDLLPEPGYLSLTDAMQTAHREWYEAVYA